MPYFIRLIFTAAICIISQIATGQITDTLGRSTFSVRYHMTSESGKYAPRYRILRNVNENYKAIDFSYSIQDNLRETGYGDSSLLSGINFLSGKYDELPVSPMNEKEVFYGVWRNRLVKSADPASIENSMEEGTKALLKLGYTDLGNDFLPFITGIMEEQHLINYDPARTRVFGKGSKGTVTSVQILNALGSENTFVNYGVCRDVHETARELLKSLCSTYYGNLYPDKHINFDDYLFLQSWTTNKSQHVTLSFIDPVDTKRVYELDWGRVIERTAISKYNNGRMYGNTFRIWKYDSQKQRSIPVDFKRTQFGKILDENILSPDEYMQFNGVYDTEEYSDISYRNKTGKFGHLNFSAGTYHPSQRYFIGGWNYTTTGKKVAFLRHSTLFALQGAVQEDTRKKQLLYPQNDWDMTVSLMGIPRVISRFETPVYRKGNFSFNMFANQQFDIFLLISAFKYTDLMNDEKQKEISWSGDGNLSFSNGFRLRHSTKDNVISNSIILQARSCLLPNDIRLMTPNPVTLFSHLRFVTPAMDAITNTVFSFRKSSSLSVSTIFEFTNLGAVIFSGNVSSGSALTKKLYYVLSAGATEQLNGIHYFWYPSERKRADFTLGIDKNQFSAGLMKYPLSPVTCNLSFRRIID